MNKSKNLGTGWIAVYQNPAGWLAQQRLSGEQYSVLFALFNRLDFENFLRISRQEIVDFLSMQPVSVSRAMKKLKNLEIIIEGSPAGKFKTYCINSKNVCSHPKRVNLLTPSRFLYLPCKMSVLVKRNCNNEC